MKCQTCSGEEQGLTCAALDISFIQPVSPRGKQEYVVVEPHGCRPFSVGNALGQSPCSEAFPWFFLMATKHGAEDTARCGEGRIMGPLS